MTTVRVNSIIFCLSLSTKCFYTCSIQPFKATLKNMSVSGRAGEDEKGYPGRQAIFCFLNSFFFSL